MDELDNIQDHIYVIRGYRVMLQLTEEEWRTFKVNFFKSYRVENESDTDLRSQFVTANYIKKQRSCPYAFTEIGVAMLSSVLKSEVAIQANRKIMKAFVAYRHLAELPLAATYLDLSSRNTYFHLGIDLLQHLSTLICRLRPKQMFFVYNYEDTIFFKYLAR